MSTGREIEQEMIRNAASRILALEADRAAANARTETAWMDPDAEHLNGFEYTQSCACDGSDVQVWRRTPRYIIREGPWERVDGTPGTDPTRPEVAS
jgi:hypothetical protein